jgi:endonuclease YncB( thermonuclease family)
MFKTIAISLALTFAACASPIELSQVEITDGDTIKVDGITFRLVGFDAPETYQAKCVAEKNLGEKATLRLKRLMAEGNLDLEQVACSCRPGLEGTYACNFGRSCGILRVRGK